MQITEVGTAPNTRVNVDLEPNCKPNYVSLMNYAFGFTGLLDDDGVPHVDFSGGKIDDIDETSLRDGALVGTSPAYMPQDPERLVCANRLDQSGQSEEVLW